MDTNPKQDADVKDVNAEAEQSIEDAKQKNKTQTGQLSKEDLPESTNESTGVTGSGQRQDSN